MGALSRAGIVAAAGLLAGAAPQGEVPEALQAAILAKALTFDRSLATRSGDTLVLAVLAQKGVPESRRAGEMFIEAFRSPALAKIAGIPTILVLLEVDAGEDLRSRLIRAGAELAYVAPLRGVDAGTVAATLRGAGVVGVTGVETYVTAGIPLGVGMRGGHPILVVNLAAARAVGVDFDARLLKLARVVDR